MWYSTPAFRPGLWAEIILSLLRWEGKQKNSLNPFRIFLSFLYSFGIETITTFIHSLSSLENHTRFQTKMEKVYTRLQTKTAQKPHPRGAAHTCIAYIREFSPGEAGTKRPSRRSPSRRELTVHQNFIKESTSTMWPLDKRNRFTFFLLVTSSLRSNKLVVAISGPSVYTIQCHYNWLYTSELGLD